MDYSSIGKKDISRLSFDDWTEGLGEYACQLQEFFIDYILDDIVDADFFKIASTGTRSLALFYYWYICMEKASFVFIDEFDAFYHFELSESVQKRLKKCRVYRLLLLHIIRIL